MADITNYKYIKCPSYDTNQDNFPLFPSSNHPHCNQLIENTTWRLETMIKNGFMNQKNLQGGNYPNKSGVFFYIFILFFIHVYRPCATLWVMTDLGVSTCKNLAWLTPLSYSFPHCLAAFQTRRLGFFPPNSTFLSTLIHYKSGVNQGGHWVLWNFHF